MAGRDVATIRPGGPLRGSLGVPGDKSITHRGLIFNALAGGEARVRNYLDSADCRSTMACLSQWGAEFARDGDAVIVRSGGQAAFTRPAGALDCGNSGTTMRLLSGAAAGLPFTTTLTGDESLRKRPMGRVLSPLASMGAETGGADGGGTAPISLRGPAEGLRPFRGRLEVASAQVKSAVVLAALRADGESVIEEPGPSRDHTERMLAAMGAEIEVDGARISVRPGAALRAMDVSAPGDASAASFWIAAATIVPGSELRLPGVGVNPRRTGAVDVLRAMGARIAFEHERIESGERVADICISSAPLRGMRVSGDLIVRALDELPVIAAAAAMADGVTEIRDAAELRVKESDRIATTAAMLRVLGVEVVEHEDGLDVIGGGIRRGGLVESRGDHRIAMAAAVAAMAGPEAVEIAGAGAADVSYPEFWRDLEAARDGAAV